MSQDDQKERREGTYFEAIDFACWPTESVSRHPVSAGGVLTIRATKEGSIAAVVFFEADQSVLCASSPPIQFEGPPRVIVCAAWSADSITLFLDNLEVQNRVELMVLKTAPRKALLPTSSTFDSEAARAACEDEMRARTLRYAPRPQKGKRSLSLAEDKQRLEGMLRALGEDISQIQAGASYRVGDLRGKLRQLVVAGGKHYQPALFRVAARLRAPLPVCDVGDASVRESRKSPALLRISGLRMGTQLFESAELLDFETWMRRRIVVAIDGTGRNAADLIMSASENVEGAHAGPNVPLDVDRLEQHSSGGITALTSLFLRIAAVTTELGNFVLAWPEPHPNES